MKKITTLIVLFFVAGVIFGQEYTFQGLPWGSTREQVIAKLGEPNNVSNNNSTTAFINTRLVYLVTLNGYNTRLDTLFHNSRLTCAYYTINVQPFRIFNETQLNIVFLALFRQITEKYGVFHEAFTHKTDENYQYWVWHFDNFHIYISSIGSLNTFEITYCSDEVWKKTEEDLIRTMYRIPNNGL